MLIRPLPGDREITNAEHLGIMNSQAPMIEEQLRNIPSDSLPRDPNGPLEFYYGLYYDQMFLFMFKQPQNFRFAYSPCGAGKVPAWNPAWDYVLHLDDAKVGKTYTWDVCLAVKPYQGRKDVLREVSQYRQNNQIFAGM
jgi:hypothetical protein